MIKKVVITIIAIMLAFTNLIIPMKTIKTSNATSNTTSVLEDLEVDPYFNKEDYTTNIEDLNFYIITIAESINLELFIYVYQPSENMTATSINISTAYEDEDLDFTNYKLIFLSEDGVFQKYRVEDFEVVEDKSQIRVYEISSIFRKWSEELGDSAEDLTTENTVNERALAINKRFELASVGGTNYVSEQDIETIKVENKLVGFCRYYDENKLSQIFFPGWEDTESKDVHYLAFSTDRKIDKLMEADLIYSKKVYERIKVSSLGVDDSTKILSDTKNIKVQLNSSTKQEIEVDGKLDKYTYTWNAIQTVDEFLEEENKEYIYNRFILLEEEVSTQINEEVINEFCNKELKFVLRFAITDYTYGETNSSGGLISVNTKRWEWSEVYDVSLLRLKFETDGVVYNLGVIDDKTTGSTTPSNTQNVEVRIDWDKLGDMFKNGFDDITQKILLIIGLMALVVVGIQLLPLLIKFVVFVITLPFKIIKFIGDLFK